MMRVVLIVFMGVLVYAGFERWKLWLALNSLPFITGNIKFASIPVGAVLMAYYLIRDMFSNSGGC